MVKQARSNSQYREHVSIMFPLLCFLYNLHHPFSEPFIKADKKMKQDIQFVNMLALIVCTSSTAFQTEQI